MVRGNRTGAITSSTQDRSSGVSGDSPSGLFYLHFMAHEKFMIVDGHALLHRAWHALPPLTTQKGEVVNAVFGFAQILLKALKELKPAYCIVTFDRKGPTFRHEAYTEYKATRVKQPDELYAQIPRIKQMLEGLAIPIYELDGFEADDIIATLSKKIGTQHPDFETVIVTGDMDTLQLVDDRTRVYAPKKGMSDAGLLDVDAVRQRYDGLSPSDITFFKALRGDPSDNIPGIKGIGEKTAIEVVKAFQNKQNFLDWIAGKKTIDTGHLKKAVIEKLQTNADAFRLSWDLVALRFDAPVALDLDGARLGQPNNDILVPLFQELEFKTLLPRLHDLLGNSSENDTGHHHVAPSGYRLLDTPSKISDFLEVLGTQSLFAFDTETTSIDALNAELVGLSISFKDGEAVYIPWKICDKNNRDAIKRILENDGIKKTGHNIKYDLHVVKNVGIDLAGIAFDTMVGAYLLNPGARGYGLDALSFNEFGHQKISIESLIGKGKKQLSMVDVPLKKISEYACEDADFAWRLWGHIHTALEKEQLLSLCEEIEIPLISVLARMERSGVKIDSPFLATLSTQLTNELTNIEKKIYGYAGSEFNINSPLQLKKVLFEDLKISAPKLKKGKTGISTAASELEKMRGLHPIIDCVLEYRERTKLLNTYIDVLPTLVDEKTGRVHTSFNQTIAATGRLSSSNPNFQNIPIREELGREIRKSIIAEKGNILLAADYSQLELRIVASFAKDETMLSAFREGKDIHAMTAAAVHGIELEDVTPQMRRAAKEVNFGIIYGMGAHGLSVSTGISVDEARDFITRYFEVYPGIAEYMERTLIEARKVGYVETILGRRRYLPDLSSSLFQLRAAAERAAINMPFQGTGADIIKISMLAIDKHLCKKEWSGAHMLLQVHDELIFELPEARVHDLVTIVKKEMEGALTLAAPLVVDTKVGYNWGEMKSL